MAWVDEWVSDEDVLRAQLGQFGLGSLAGMVLEMLKDPNASDEYIIAKIRETPEYQARFPAMKALKEANRAISEQAYIEYETTIRESARLAGVPEAMFTGEYIGEMLKVGVSAREFQQRLGMASAAALTAPPEVKQALRDLYGLEQSDLTTYWLDPDEALPLLVQRQQAAELAGAGLRNNITISREYAERLAAEGVATSEGARGFEAAAAQMGLVGEQGVAGQDIIEAQFGDVEARRKVERAARSRTGRFEGGGGAAEGQQGIVGLAEM